MGLFGMEYEDWVAQTLPEKVEQSLAWIRDYEAEALRTDPRGYYVAFSGGKDSIVLERLFRMARVKYEAWYNNVTIDPPELVRFIKQYYPDVPWNNPEKHLIRMMVEKGKGPPNRYVRWCCEIYKEQGGNGRFKAVGVRAPESPRRKANWTFLSSSRQSDDPILCPLIYWTDSDIWQFIQEQQMPYCSLYDEGFKRLGCVGCPMAGGEQQKRDFERWPGYQRMWRKGITDFWNKWHDVPTRRGGDRSIKRFSAEGLWNWWTSGKADEGEGTDCQSFLW